MGGRRGARSGRRPASARLGIRVRQFKSTHAVTNYFEVASGEAVRRAARAPAGLRVSQRPRGAGSAAGKRGQSAAVVAAPGRPVSPERDRLETPTTSLRGVDVAKRPGEGLAVDVARSSASPEQTRADAGAAAVRRDSSPDARRGSLQRLKQIARPRRTAGRARHHGGRGRPPVRLAGRPAAARSDAAGTS